MNRSDYDRADRMEKAQKQKADGKPMTFNLYLKSIADSQQLQLASFLAKHAKIDAAFYSMTLLDYIELFEAEYLSDIEDFDPLVQDYTRAVFLFQQDKNAELNFWAWVLEQLSEDEDEKDNTKVKGLINDYRLKLADRRTYRKKVENKWTQMLNNIRK